MLPFKKKLQRLLVIKKPLRDDKISRYDRAVTRQSRLLFVVFQNKCSNHRFKLFHTIQEIRLKCGLDLQQVTGHSTSLLKVTKRSEFLGNVYEIHLEFDRTRFC